MLWAVVLVVAFGVRFALGAALWEGNTGGFGPSYRSTAKTTAGQTSS